MSTTDAGVSVANKNSQTGSAKKKRKKSFVRETIEVLVSSLVGLIILHWAVGENRYIPSPSMEPNLKQGDRIFVEKLSQRFGRRVERGDILVFYPPPRFLQRRQRQDWLTELGNLTGLPFLPYETALIKRVVGLPGEEIRVVPNVGVSVNGKLIDESGYVKEPAGYRLKFLGDIGGLNGEGKAVRPYPARYVGLQRIIVPPNHYFMMGDNRNDSEDSHVWGFLNKDRVIGRACCIFWRPFGGVVYPQHN